MPGLNLGVLATAPAIRAILVPPVGRAFAEA
jgi:hypothetical protein